MNSTSSSGPLAQALGTITYEFDKMRPLLPTYIHLLVSAIFPIYTAAHASLARPSSASPAKKKRGAKKATNDDEEEELSPKLETLSVSDAILFPILAGVTLGALYLIIKWLEDPALLNKILGYYFSWVGLFFTYKFIKDILGFFRSLAFPAQYSSANVLWHVADNNEEHFISHDAPSRHGTAKRSSPLPGHILGTISFPSSISSALWKVRRALYYRTDLRLRTSSPLPKSEIKARLTPAIDLPAFSAAFGLLVYQLINQNSSKTWYLTNFSGFSFCHGSLQFLTPGTGGVGTLLLALLFCYDIYMVFFTPMMVTVATKLDVPIKLLFPRPDGCIYPVGAPEGSAAMEEYLECLAKKRTMAMLGLGDIVIPGMMVAYALRYDLYKFYLNLQNAKTSGDGKVVSKKQTDGKPVYVPARGSWGERLWISTYHRTHHPDCATLRAKTFPKTYFYASLIGYIVGMILTMLVMQVYQHAQPALLYLVPGVLISLWGTALLKGDVKSLWDYDESAAEETAKGTKKSGDSSKTEKDDTKAIENGDASTKNEQENGKKTPKGDKQSKSTKDEEPQKKISFSFKDIADFSFSLGSIFSCSIKPVGAALSSPKSIESATPKTPSAVQGKVYNLRSSDSQQDTDFDFSSNPSSPEVIEKEEVLEAEASGISTRSRRRDTQEPPGKRRRRA